MLRSDPIAVLSSPVSKPLRQRRAAAPLPGTAPSLRPEPRVRLLLSLWRRRQGLASWEILASVIATSDATAHP